MNKPSFLLCALLLAGFALPAQAQTEAPPPPPMPDDTHDSPPLLDDMDSMEPEVRIIRRGEDTIEEFRSGGRVYMVRITPAKGRPYYLIDSDGNGVLDTRREALQPAEVVKWRIFTW